MQDCQDGDSRSHHTLGGVTDTASMFDTVYGGLWMEV